MLLGSAIVENVIGKVEQWYDGFCIQVSFRIYFYYSILKFNGQESLGLLEPFPCRPLQEEGLLIQHQRIARQIRR